MNRRSIPNLITVFRIFLVVPLIVLVLEGQYLWVLLLFAVAGISDGIDGYLARRYQWQSRLGALLDPLADKLLMVSAFVALGYIGHIPLWLVVLVIVRDIIIVSGAVAFRLLLGYLDMEPIRLSKLNTFLQITLVLTTLIDLASDWIPPYLLDGLIVVCAIFTVASGAMYVWIWMHRARREWKEKFQ